MKLLSITALIYMTLVLRTLGESTIPDAGAPQDDKLDNINVSTNEMMQILLVTGQDYPGHKWRETAPVLAEAIGADPRLHVTVVEEPSYLALPELQDYDAIVLHFMDWEQPSPGEEARTNLKRFVEGGKGLVLVHFACGAWQDWPDFRDIAGRVWDPDLRPHDPHGTFRVQIASKDHPITQGLEHFDTVDELYTCLTGDAPIEVLATARSKVDGKDYPMAFTLSYGEGRVFHSVLGHDVAALANPPVAELFRRASAWAAGLAPARKKVVFLAGPASHGRGAHEWDKDAALLKEALDASPAGRGIETSLYLNGWPDFPEVLERADAIVMLCDGLESHPLASRERLERIGKLAARGCGLCFIHYAVAPPPGHEKEWLEWIGGYWEKDYSANPVSTVEVRPATAGHPVCRNWTAFTARDEFYYRIRFREDDKRRRPIMTAMLPPNDPHEEVVAWVVERADGGRGFGFTGGHFHKNWAIEPFRTMTLNAIVWCAKA
ncbi:MAG TPA: ThuA domain-containing protein [Candidatus Hydrogenedentes bacterium]|nr:ThuA domain-containing protein [Candidatus Hydrogenedentota bacterium]